MYSAFTSPGQAGCRTRLTACGETQAAFERRCIPPEPRRFAALCVAFRSKYTRYSSLTRLVSRAPPRSRRSPGFHHRLLTACGKSQAAFGRRSIPAEPLRFAPFCVAFRSKYTRYSSLTRLVSRTPTGRTGPRPHRENWPTSALTRVSPQAVNAGQLEAAFPIPAALEVDRRCAVRCADAQLCRPPGGLAGGRRSRACVPSPTISGEPPAALRAAVPTGGRRSKPSPRFLSVGDSRSRPHSADDAGRRPAHSAGRPLRVRSGLGAGGRN